MSGVCCGGGGNDIEFVVLGLLSREMMLSTSPDCLMKKGKEQDGDGENWSKCRQMYSWARQARLLCGPDVAEWKLRYPARGVSSP
jgi:hypothetical protein